VAGARVTVSTDSPKYGAITTPEGKFSWDKLPPGSYGAIAETPGFSPSRPKAFEIKADSGVQRLEMRIAPEAVITGRVVDSSGDPVQFVDVQVQRGDFRATESTDHHGQFRIAGLAAGNYRVLASPGAPGLLQLANTFPAEIRTDGTKEQINQPTWYPDTLEASAGADTVIEIHLQKTDVTGISGIITGPGNSRVTAIAIRHGESGAYPVFLSKDRFSVWRIPPGRYTIRASRTLDGGALVTGALEVDVGAAPVTNMEIRLAPEFDVTGQIIWSSKEPEKHPQIRLEPLVRNNQRSFGPVQPDSDSSFLFKGVWSGTYRMLTGDKAYVKSVLVDSREVVDQTVTLTGSPKSLTVILSNSTGQLSGVVTAGQEPVQVTVRLTEEDRNSPQLLQVTTDSSGSYSFDHVPPGKYRLTVEDQSETIEIREGLIVTKDLRVRP
jgi:hypothetical protein